MANVLHPQSNLCVKSELDLFQLPPTQVAIQDGHHVEHRPLSSITDQGPVEFFVAPSDVEYIDPNDTYLYVKMRVLNADGTPLAHDAAVGPENLTLHSLWSQVDVFLNDTLITPSNNTYPYRAYLETLLSYGEDAKKSFLQLAMFFKDKAGHMDAMHAANTGLRDRRQFINGGRPVELFGRLHVDLFHQDRLLVNGVGMKLRLVRSKDAFVLHSNDGEQFKINIQDVSLYVRKVKVNPQVQLAHLQTLQKGNAKYPLKRVVTKVFAVPQGQMQVQKENLFLGQLPNRLIIGLITNQAFHGSYAHNPFNFKHYNTNYICLHVGGHSIPAKPFTPNFEQGLFARSFFTLSQAAGTAFQDAGNGIHLSDYDKGYTLWVFDLTADDSASADHSQLIKHGNMRLEIHFADALPHTINIIAHAEFQNLMEIDKHHNILVDFSA
jgi:hypothetical protein